MKLPHLTPEDARQVERAKVVFDEYLRAHLVKDVKILISTHALLVTAVIIGFIWVMVLMYRLFFGFD